MSQIEQPYITSIHAIKNTRRKMEDRHVVIHDLNATLNLEGATKKYSYYAIFDGHAGVDAASFAAQHLHEKLVKCHYFKEGDIPAALKWAFSETDLSYLERSALENTKCGCTAVCCLIEDRKKLFFAWLGDSQAFLVKNGQPCDVMEPHKPDREDEQQRIRDMGGEVIYIDTWRVDGTLAVSRAIGDPDYKPYVSSDCEVIEINLDGSEDMVIMACDGLWDQLTPQDATSLVYQHLHEATAKGTEPLLAAEQVSQLLIQMAKEEGSSDNITAVVVFLKDIESILKTTFTPPPKKESLSVAYSDDMTSSNGFNQTLNTSSGLAFNSTSFSGVANASSPGSDLLMSMAYPGSDSSKQMFEADNDWFNAQQRSNSNGVHVNNFSNDRIGGGDGAGQDSQSAHRDFEWSNSHKHANDHSDDDEEANLSDEMVVHDDDDDDDSEEEDDEDREVIHVQPASGNPFAEQNQFGQSSTEPQPVSPQPLMEEQLKTEDILSSPNEQRNLTQEDFLPSQEQPPLSPSMESNPFSSAAPPEVPEVPPSSEPQPTLNNEAMQAFYNEQEIQEPIFDQVNDAQTVPVKEQESELVAHHEEMDDTLTNESQIEEVQNAMQEPMAENLVTINPSDIPEANPGIVDFSNEENQPSVIQQGQQEFIPFEQQSSPSPQPYGHEVQPTHDDMFSVPLKSENENVEFGDHNENIEEPKVSCDNHEAFSSQLNQPHEQPLFSNAGDTFEQLMPSSPAPPQNSESISSPAQEEVPQQWAQEPPAQVPDLEQDQAFSPVDMDQGFDQNEIIKTEEPPVQSPSQGVPSDEPPFDEDDQFSRSRHQFEEYIEQQEGRSPSPIGPPRAQSDNFEEDEGFGGMKEEEVPQVPPIQQPSFDVSTDEQQLAPESAPQEIISPTPEHNQPASENLFSLDENPTLNNHAWSNEEPKEIPQEISKPHLANDEPVEELKLSDVSTPLPKYTDFQDVAPEDRDNLQTLPPTRLSSSSETTDEPPDVLNNTHRNLEISSSTTASAVESPEEKATIRNDDEKPADQSTAVMVGAAAAAALAGTAAVAAAASKAKVGTPHPKAAATSKPASKPSTSTLASRGAASKPAVSKVSSTTATKAPSTLASRTTRTATGVATSRVAPSASTAAKAPAKTTTGIAARTAASRVTSTTATTRPTTAARSAVTAKTTDATKPSATRLTATRPAPAKTASSTTSRLNTGLASRTTAAKPDASKPSVSTTRTALSSTRTATSTATSKTSTTSRLAPRAAPSTSTSRVGTTTSRLATTTRTATTASSSATSGTKPVTKTATSTASRTVGSRFNTGLRTTATNGTAKPAEVARATSSTAAKSPSTLSRLTTKTTSPATRASPLNKTGVSRASPLAGTAASTKTKSASPATATATSATPSPRVLTSRQKKGEQNGPSLSSELAAATQQEQEQQQQQQQQQHQEEHQEQQQNGHLEEVPTSSN